MKEQILELATAQIKRGGYNELSFGNIAKALDISRANIHHHYENKETLAEAALCRYVSEEKIRRKMLSDLVQGDFKKMIMLMEDSIWGWIEKGGKEYCACHSFITKSEKVPDHLKKIAFNFFDDLLEFMEEQASISQSKGLLKSDRPPREIAQEALLLFSGFFQCLKMSPLDEEKLSQTKGVLTRWAESL